MINTCEKYIKLQLFWASRIVHARVFVVPKICFNCANTGQRRPLDILVHRNEGNFVICHPNGPDV